MTDHHEQPRAKDYLELEGLRGFLVLSVAVEHSYEVLKYAGNGGIWRLAPYQRLHSFDEYIVRTILALAEGFGAVLVFFAVSGFVLAHALTKRSEALFTAGPGMSGSGRLKDQYRYLGLQRFFRIFPLHWTVLFLIAACLPFIEPAVSTYASDFYNAYQTRVPVREELLGFVFFSNLSNPPTWSLFHETWPLVAFPLLLLLLDRLRDVASQILFLVILFMAGLATQLWLDVSWLRNPFLFLSLFVGGAVAYKHQEALRKIKMGPPLLYWLALSSVRMVPIGFQNAYIWFWMGAFALLLLSAVISAGNNAVSGRVLRSRVMVWLGTRSYGIYILHFPVNYLISTEVLKHAPESILNLHAVATGTFIAAASILTTALICGFAVYPFESYWQQLRQKITSPRERTPAH